MRRCQTLSMSLTRTLKHLLDSKTCGLVENCGTRKGHLTHLTSHVLPFEQIESPALLSFVSFMHLADHFWQLLNAKGAAKPFELATKTGDIHLIRLKKNRKSNNIRKCRLLTFQAFERPVGTTTTHLANSHNEGQENN